ncbi:MAG: pentapeptide repeat-containing protein [Theionarchaea archaeon]|nr:pentapeptide repeat-containing protein [Theionarchaea archaeon]
MGPCSYTWEEWDREKGSFERQCQKNTWEGSEQYCIFHDPSPDKDPELFRQKMEEQLTGEYYNFRGYYFPIDWDFKNIKFDKSADFRKATFQNTDFRYVTFQNAYFNGTTFRGHTDFGGVDIQECVEFIGATFQNADFSGANFQEAHFSLATFHGHAEFREATFQNSNFSGATFQGTADFGGAIFHRLTEFRGATFRNTAEFSPTTFHQINFKGAIFLITNFHGANFGNSNFSEATFQEYVDFSEATFQESTNFRCATFQKAYFDGAKFQEHTDFGEAVFQGYAEFKKITFRDVDFSEATFRDVDFSEATFQENADFRKANIEKNFEFIPKHNHDLDFRGAQFLFRGNIKANISKARFHRAYLDNIVFDCIWPDKIYEEEYMTDEDVNLSLKELETIYRNLKQNMQRHGDYSQAGELYYREMECKRRNMKEKRFSSDWFKSYVYSFLKCTCGYGEKPERVILASVLIIFVAAFLFVFNGIAIGEYTPEERIINYDLSLTVPSMQAVKDFVQCLYYSVVTFTTLGYGDIHPVGYSKLVASAEAFTGAFFIALFVLVFGRKMMR